MSSAIVLLSGGMDSAICLGWAFKNFDEVHPLSIHYKQRHMEELKHASKVAEAFGLKTTLFDVGFLQTIGDSALLGSGDIHDTHRDPLLPATFVPGRNILFLLIAGMIGYKMGVFNIVGGMCQTDYSGYPDCRQPFITSMETSLILGMDAPFTIYTPLMFKTKAEALQLAVELDCFSVLKHTYTCYNGDETPCGKCKACELRQKGFEEAGLVDPALEV